MPSFADEPLCLALCGDVMTGRGIDQILPHPGDPILHEDWIRDARKYVALAENANGPIGRAVKFEYIWGDALPSLHEADVRIVNLETSITRAEEWARGKGIHYRMSPENVACLGAVGINVCSVANNHVLDWGYDGLAETLQTLHGAGIATAGAGSNLTEAAFPAVVAVANKARVLVVGLGFPSSGIPMTWAATQKRAGVNVLGALPADPARAVARELLTMKRRGDVTVVSIHWGGNWGYGVPAQHIEFAHALADAGIDVIHGHSSHHPRAIELRGTSVILYGCGDFINDYEGIKGGEDFRGDLALLYRVKIIAEPQRHAQVSVLPFQRQRMRLSRASVRDAEWLGAMLRQQSAAFETTVLVESDRSLTIRPTEPTSDSRRASPRNLRRVIQSPLL